MADWAEFRQAALDRVVLIGMVLIDAVFVTALLLLFIYEDKLKEFMFSHVGQPGLSIRIPVAAVEILLDLGMIATVGGWIFNDLRATFRRAA